ncbi:hypothetical protein [Pseudanabaena sp. FACHB-2040]|uniref:hypothetical protein n=1 Tax=Pseudanabaena sp. FACHB-2040 TaxID=2692859 RepID=UPI001687A731|nr:hypothetical protein [Pseudanabaena sp. FACHB-2040]MBD2258564.1 hypothetical protein [Pseudanabaena sp. FACHB-2040]
MHDNKVRLSRDVLEKAESIAAEWGLKNARAAIEAVFRRYCDDYLYGRLPTDTAPPLAASPSRRMPDPPTAAKADRGDPSQCEALDALDELLSL